MISLWYLSYFLWIRAANFEFYQTNCTFLAIGTSKVTQWLLPICNFLQKTLICIGFLISFKNNVSFLFHIVWSCKSQNSHIQLVFYFHSSRIWIQLTGWWTLSWPYTMPLVMLGPRLISMAAIIILAKTLTDGYKVSQILKLFAFLLIEIFLSHKDLLMILFF